MPVKIHSKYKQSVIRLWMTGLSRDEIANRTRLSTGTVSNVIGIWQRGLKRRNYEDVRRLAVNSKKLGLSLKDASICIRLLKLLRKYNVREEAVESFVIAIIEKCVCRNLDPERIISSAMEILDLSLGEEVPVSAVPLYIQKKIEEKKRIEGAIEDLEGYLEKKVEEKKRIEGAIAGAKATLESIRNEEEKALQGVNVTIQAIDGYRRLSSVLRNYGLPAEETDRLVNILERIRDLGADPKKIVVKLSEITSLEDSIKAASNTCAILERRAREYQEKFKIFREIRAMSLTYSQVRMLFNKIADIAANHGLNQTQAMEKLFSDLDSQYDAKVGFENALQTLQAQIHSKKDQLDRLELDLASKMDVASALQDLLSRGVSEENILYWDGIVKKYGGGSGVVLKRLVEEIKSHLVMSSEIQKLQRKQGKLVLEIQRLMGIRNSLIRDREKIKYDIALLVETAKKSMEEIVAEALMHLKRVGSNVPGS